MHFLMRFDVLYMDITTVINRTQFKQNNNKTEFLKMLRLSNINHSGSLMMS